MSNVRNKFLTKEGSPLKHESITYFFAWLQEGGMDFFSIVFLVKIDQYFSTV